MKSILKTVSAAIIIATAGISAQASEIDAQIMLLDMQVPNQAQNCEQITMGSQILPELMAEQAQPEAVQGVIAVNIMPETGGFATQMQPELAPTCSAFSIVPTYDI